MATTSREEKKAAKAAKKLKSREQRKQIWDAFQMQRKEDRALVPLMLIVFVSFITLGVLLGFVTSDYFVFVPIGIILGGLVAFVVFTQRLKRKSYSKADGTPGAAGWVLENMRGAWRVQASAASNSHLDLVHRVIGLPGVILVTEGNSARVKDLLNAQRRSLTKIIGDTPIYTINCGNGEGDVKLSQLERHLRKLPHNISREHIEVLDKRLTAMKNRGPAIPKGPMPKGAKVRGVNRAIKRK